MFFGLVGFGQEVVCQIVCVVGYIEMDFFGLGIGVGYDYVFLGVVDVYRYKVIYQVIVVCGFVEYVVDKVGFVFVIDIFEIKRDFVVGLCLGYGVINKLRVV